MSSDELSSATVVSRARSTAMYTCPTCNNDLEFQCCWMCKAPLCRVAAVNCDSVACRESNGCEARNRFRAEPVFCSGKCKRSAMGPQDTVGSGYCVQCVKNLTAFDSYECSCSWCTTRIIPISQRGCLRCRPSLYACIPGGILLCNGSACKQLSPREIGIFGKLRIVPSSNPIDVPSPRRAALDSEDEE